MLLVRTSILCQERTHLNPVRRGYTWILYQEGQLTHLNPISGRTVDTPQSYIRRGQWTHLNPMPGEDSEHTSILVQERTVNTPQSWSGENSEHTSILVRRGYLYIRRGHTSILCQYGRETSRSLIIIGRPRKTPSSKTLKVSGKDGDDFEV
jgi:hypothetical protein